MNAIKTMLLSTLFAGLCCVAPILAAAESSNVSQGKPTSQSSTNGVYVSSLAVDKDTNGVSFTQTQDEVSPWWNVDLGKAYTIDRISLSNRKDCCSERPTNFYVSLLGADGEVIWVNYYSGITNPSTEISLTPPVAGVSQVRVQLNDSGILSLVDVQVFGNPSNIALGKTATQSSTYTSRDGVSYDASRAVDGNTDDSNGQSFTQTQSEAAASWKVNLGRAHTIDKVILWHHQYCCGDQLANFYVSFLDANGEKISWQQYPGPAGRTTELTPSEPVAGVYYVQVQRNRSGVLSLAEVQVFGTPSNLALGKTTSQSSTNGVYVSSLAVDGNTNGDDTNGKSFTQTLDDRNQWWNVNLGKAHTVGKVILWNRKDCCSEQLTNFTVSLLDANGSAIYEQPYPGTAGFSTEINLPKPVADVSQVRVKLNGSGILSLAEVQVFGAVNNIVERSSTKVGLSNGYTATGSPTDSSGIAHFLAIPYAKPPIGTLRWKPPVLWDNSAPIINPGNPAAINFDPAGLGWKRVPQCMPGSGAAENSIDLGTFPLWVPSRITGIKTPLLTVSSENCLYLNVYTKYANQVSVKKPVFVWIHGGGNRNGTAMTSIYDPTPKGNEGTVPAFMQTVDAVVVTINYRLGPFGFLAHSDLTKEAGTSGTYGNLDQIMALKWVQSHIDKFGGDPTNVTVFGESAGALNTSILNASPLANGLFARTIQQSGYNLPVFWAANRAGILQVPGTAFNKKVLTGIADGPKWPTLSDLESIGKGLNTVLADTCPPGVTSGQEGGLLKPWGACSYRNNLTLDDLRKLSPGIIGAAYSNSGTQSGSTPAGLGISVVAPPIDGKLLTMQPVDAKTVSTKGLVIKPSIIGSNRDEYTYLLQYFAPSLKACAISGKSDTCTNNANGVNLLSSDGSGFKAILEGIFGATNGDAAFIGLPAQYKPTSYTDPKSVRDAAVKLLTDVVFTCHSLRLIRSTASQTPTAKNYAYQFTYQPGLLKTPTVAGALFASASGYRDELANMGAFHALDIGYVFGMPFIAQLFAVDSVEKQLATTIQSRWGEFGATGTLSSEWPQYPSNGLVKDEKVYYLGNQLSGADNIRLSAKTGLQFKNTAVEPSQCLWLARYDR